MSIIYFITTQDIDTFQKKLQETLFNAVTMPFPLLFDNVMPRLSIPLI